MRVLAVLTLLPAAAYSCPACFSADPDQAALGRAFNTALFLLLGVTFSLLAGGTVWFWRIERRRQALDQRYLDLIG